MQVKEDDALCTTGQVDLTKSQKTVLEAGLERAVDCKRQQGKLKQKQHYEALSHPWWQNQGIICAPQVPHSDVSGISPPRKKVMVTTTTKEVSVSFVGRCASVEPFEFISSPYYPLNIHVLQFCISSHSIFDF